MRSEIKDFLLANGVGHTAHSGLTLWHHLQGVHRILVASGHQQYVCEAGLFHSIYGTQAFNQVTIEKSRRTEVQALIGEKAESLVMAFCMLPRPKLLEASLQHSGSAELPTWMAQVEAAYDKSVFFDDLLRLECANLLEQRMLYTFPYLTRHAQGVGMLDQEGFSV